MFLSKIHCDRIEQLKVELPEILEFDREIPNINLVELSDENYLEGHKLYEKAINRHPRMLRAMMEYFENRFSEENSCTILSVGCGSLMFETLILEQLVLKYKTIHFVAVDINKNQIVEAKKILTPCLRNIKTYLLMRSMQTSTISLFPKILIWFGVSTPYITFLNWNRPFLKCSLF